MPQLEGFVGDNLFGVSLLKSPLGWHYLGALFWMLVLGNATLDGIFGPMEELTGACW